MLTVCDANTWPCFPAIVTIAGVFLGSKGAIDLIETNKKVRSIALITLAFVASLYSGLCIHQALTQKLTLE